MRKFVTFGPALVVILATLVTLVAAPAAVRRIGYAQTEATIHLANQTLEDDDILRRIDRATRAIAAAVEPSVVHIAVVQADRRGFTRASQGSGWVFDEAGHIITNFHVVRGASRVTVQFSDGRQVRAEMVGSDRKTDIAVLRVSTSEGIFPARLASEYEPQQGDRVYAFGSPFGFKFSMSEGIISGLGRDPRAVIGEDGYTNFIQTDAAVNPGNSGGPLVNVEGRVIGMNVAIATGRESNGAQPEEGQSAGISFAIPLSTIEPVVQRIISGGAAPKGFLGIQYLGIDERNTARLLDLGIRKQGVYIDEVTEEAPAARAGLKPGDVIVAINSRTVTGLPAFRTMVANAGPGEIVDVRVLRKGEELDFKVTLDPMPPSRVELREILEAMASFGITGFGETDDTALVIADVSARSAAAQEGFRVGQTITSVERQRVTQLDQLMVSLYNAGLLLGKPVNVEVLDENGQRREMSIRQIAAP